MRIVQKALSWLVTALLPLAMTFLGVRLLLTHIFPEVEYRMPGFPADEYGFSLQDRLKWSKIAVDYLLNGADRSFLGDLIFPDGTALFNDRELSHMQDVKNVIHPVLWIGYGTWFYLLVIGVWAGMGGWRREYLLGLQRGGWLTVTLVAFISILAGTSFWQFFTLFHKLFFTGDTWLFLYSDTLIRLFPMRFWQDAFLFTGVLDLLAGLGLGLGLLSKGKQGVITDDIIPSTARRHDV